MKTNNEWRDYALIATGNRMKLERFGGVTLLRPDPQVIWDAPYRLEDAKGLDALYHRSSDGGGGWQRFRNIPETFTVSWRDLTFRLKLMGFKHTGIFPEQAVNWAKMTEDIANANREIRVLNLFGYTGGASVACAKAGAKVTHVDAAKAMCEICGENLKLSGINDSPVRFIVDDCAKFVERELKRGKQYDAIVMDPPSYGRGPKGETWKLEDKIFDFVTETAKLLSDMPLFFLINSYTTGLQPTVMKNIIDIALRGVPHETEAYEVGIAGEDGITLPCGCSAYAKFR